MGRRGYPPEFRHKVLDLVTAGNLPPPLPVLPLRACHRVALELPRSHALMIAGRYAERGPRKGACPIS